MTSLPQKLLSIILRIFFRLLYHEMAWSYDLVAATVSVGLWNDWILATTEALSGPMVLELGHGPGHLQKAMATEGMNSFGLDRSKQMGKLAQKRLRKQGVANKLVNGWGQRLPFPKQTFNQVTATFPTEYILDPMTLQEIHRVLISGGELVILPTAWITGKGWLHQAAAWLFRTTGQAGEWDDSYLNPLRGTGFDTKTIERTIKASKIKLIVATKS